MILGQYGLNPDAGIPKLGVNHADELYLMWDPVYNNHHILDSNDQSMVYQSFTSLIADLFQDFTEFLHLVRALMDHFLEGIALFGHWCNDPNEKSICNQYNSSVLYWLAL